MKLPRIIWRGPVVKTLKLAARVNELRGGPTEWRLTGIAWGWFVFGLIYPCKPSDQQEEES